MEWGQTNHGYSEKVKDHNGNNCLDLYDMHTDNIKDYMLLMEKVIAEKIKSGCVALKSALAYDRALDFSETSSEKAQRVLKTPYDLLTDEDKKAFSDYIFFELCRIAARLDVPFQIHTGLGQLNKTNALQLLEVIGKNPDTKFVLFHGGYPWIDDICSLVHNYKNVYADLCWLPIISTSAAERLIEELIEVSTIDKICWGCDTHTSEESMGALLAFRHTMATVLEKKIQNSYFTINDAKIIIQNIFKNNALELYGFAASPAK